MTCLPGSSGDEVPVALAVLDPHDLTVRWHNRTALEMLPEPQRSQGVVGHSITELIPVAEALGVTSRLREVARTGKPFHLATHVVGARGRTASASAYLLHSGELLLVTDHR